MTYIYRVLKDAPIALYGMDTSALTDSSGYNKTGVNVASGYTTTRPIVAGGKGAYQFGPTSGARVNYPVTGLMASGSTDKPFTLEAWVKPDVLAGTMALFARDNSGLFISSAGVLTFNLDMGTNDVTCQYTLENGNPYHVVAVYDSQDAYLYLNGNYVASAPVTAEHRAAGFGDTASTLRIHASSGAATTVDSPAIYNYAMSPHTVKAHYNWGTQYPKVAEISANNNANVYRIHDGTSNLSTRFQIDTEEEWNSGGFTGALAVANNALTQQYDTDNSVYHAGTWSYSVFLPQQAGVTLSGSRITWDANITNLDVQVSVNGAAFTTVTNGGSLFNGLSLDAADSEIRILINFPANLPTAIVVSGITIAAYITKDIFGTNEDIPALVADEPNAVLAEYDYEPSAFNNNAGVKMSGNNSGLTFPPDAEFGSLYALETVLFAEANPSSQRTLFVAGTSTITVATNGQWTATNMTAVYINGVAQSLGSPFAVDILKPQHVVLVFPAQAGSLYLGSNASSANGYPVRVGYAATYRNTLTAANVTAIYNAWVGTAATQWKEANKVNIFERIFAESGVAFRGYSYTWAISGAT
jgi:hypothetical protein